MSERRDLSDTERAPGRVHFPSIPGLRSAIRKAFAALSMCMVLHSASAQQFNGDNQWTAPHGVGTLVLTLGQEYSIFQAVAALRPGFEFNVGVTRFREDPDDPDDEHYASSVYLKFRLWQNEAENGGAAVSFGTGHAPSYLKEGKVVDSFRSWWANGMYTIPFADGVVTWDLMPGCILALDPDRSGFDTWNFSYGSRAALYKVIPSSAIVGEVFGTTGRNSTPMGYRTGVRWESARLIIAGTYGRQFDGMGGPRFEIGLVWLTNTIPFLRIGGDGAPSSGN